MAALHPSPARIRALQERWIGQEHRLERIAEDLMAGRDWTVHLRGLPLVEEVAPLEGEAYGRDLRGADLRRFLVPGTEVRRAREGEAALVAGIALEGLSNNTPLPGISPFSVECESADAIALAIRRGDVFLIARVDGQPAGVVRLSRRREFSEFTAGRAYAELSGLAVRPQYRRMGVGRKLVAAAERAAAEEGFGHVILHTTLELGLVPWYERLGYAQRRVRQLTFQDAPTHLDVVMSREVSVTRERLPQSEQRRFGRVGQVVA